jgi:quercetin dioxygenase-like cupin family protein
MTTPQTFIVARSAPRAPSRRAAAAAAVLTCLTAAALLALALALGEPFMRAAPAAPPAQAARVRAFYAAVNAILAGGGGAALRPLLAPDVVAHVPDREIVGSAALLAYWTAIGAASPGLRLDLDALIVDGAQAVTTVSPRTLAPPAADIVVGPPSRQILEDRFRLAGGRVAEYWTGLTANDLPRALPPLPLALWTGARQAGLARFTFPPGAALANLMAPGPHLLLAETGDVAVTLVGQAKIARGDATPAGWRPTGEGPLALRPGDALLVPRGAPHTIRNASAAAATLLGVLLSGPDEPAAVQRQQTPEQERRLLSIYASSSLDAPVVGKDGVTIKLLAEGRDRCAAANAALTVRWLALEAGQRLAARSIAGVELLAVETGVALASDEATLARVVMAGDGMAVTAGVASPIVNSGPAPDRMVLVAITGQAASCPPPNDPRDAQPAGPIPIRFPRTQT